MKTDHPCRALDHLFRNGEDVQQRFFAVWFSCIFTYLIFFFSTGVRPHFSESTDGREQRHTSRRVRPLLAQEWTRACSLRDRWGGAGILTSASEISGRFLDDVLANFLQNQHLISSQTSVEYHDLTVVLLNIAGIMLEDLT